jgi:tRNA(adenine34) deaminase
MDVALDYARRSAEWGDVPIGAVVLDAEGRIVAGAGNRRELDSDPTAHAEVLALREAARVAGEDGWRLSDATLVVTLEPCIMCAGAIVNSRLKRLVFGAFDPKSGAAGSVWDLVRDPLANHRVEVVGGVAADECGALLREFFQEQR